MVYLSLALGFLSWGLAVAAIAVRKRRVAAALIAGSFLACCACGVCPLVGLMNWINAGDFSSVEDCIRGLLLGYSVMAVVALGLNFVALRQLGE